MGLNQELSRRAALLGALVAGACAASRVAGIESRGTVAVDGLAVAYRRRDGARPVVVFDSGLGDGLDVWDATLALLPQDRAFFAYSRPGYGESAPLAALAVARTAEQAARHLHAVLGAAMVRRPFVLVGHSLGGLHIAKFAELFPREVAGLVFVDGRPPTFRAACDWANLSLCSAVGQAPAPENWPQHIRSEIAGIGASEDAAPASQAIASFPATVITSTTPWPGERGDQAFSLWLSAQEAFAGSFHNHRFVRAEGAGHYVQREQPDLVAKEIEALIARLH
ncbi:MAG TPA: hypothetical protein DHW63_10575 [Hyphomonadaceae bacterium]|nr:hypothetical protein [Hyphomonadaceae bacterium]